MRSAQPGILILLCAVLMIGCSGNRAEGVKNRSMADSTGGTDSTLQSASVQHWRERSYEEDQGALLYTRYCAVCHGQEGKGDGFNAFNLDPRPRDLSDSTYMSALSDDQILQTIRGGGRSVNKSPLMPAYGWTLSGRQVRNLASYVRTFAIQSR